MYRRLVTVASFDTPFEAAVAKLHLENEGIQAFLADEAMVNTAWHFGAAIGGVKLRVAETDVAHAERILRAVRTQPRNRSSHLVDKAEEPPAHGPPKHTRSAGVAELLHRARITAVAGILLFPLQVYSLWLLARLAQSAERLSSKDRWWALAIVVIDLPGVWFCGYLLWAALGGNFHTILDCFGLHVLLNPVPLPGQ